MSLNSAATQGLPGIGTNTSTVKFINIFKGNPVDQYFLPGGRTVSGTATRDTGSLGDDGTTVTPGYIRAGTIMGKQTTSGKYANSIIGTLNGAYASGTSMTVTAATSTELARRQGSSGTFTLVGPATANGTPTTTTITYSNVASTTIAVTAPGTAFVSGSFIMPTDGSQYPLVILADNTGLATVDENGYTQDVLPQRLAIGGLINTSNVCFWPTDTGLKSFLKTNFGTSATNLMFSDSF